MKISICQLQLETSHISANLSAILNAMDASKEADLIVFPELALLGYPANDHLFNPSFYSRLEQALQSILDKSKSMPHQGILLGYPEKIPTKTFFYNSVYLIENGKILAKRHKHLLPNNDIFNEKRYFQAGPPASCIEYKGKKLALTVCEDMWFDSRATESHLQDPIETLNREKPYLHINISASPFRKKQYASRLERAKAIVEKSNCPFVYVNTVALNDNIVFDGRSFVLDEKGKQVFEAPLCKAQNSCLHLDHLPTLKEAHKDNFDTLINVIGFGLKSYCDQSHHSKVILGLSGGIDSAVVASLATLALGKEQVKGLIMPSEYSSESSQKDALVLAQQLGISTHTVSIESLHTLYRDQYLQSSQEKLAGLADENIQARIRGNLVMMWANAEQRLALPTGNKSELAMGYSTLYGDMCGALGIIGDLYKTEVYALAEHINKSKGAMIPLNSIQKAPSAELRPMQRDQDSLPDYSALDLFLEAFLEQNLGLAELAECSGLSESEISRLSKIIKIQEFKRQQAAPVLKLSEKAFGFGRQIPIFSNFSF